MQNAVVKNLIIYPIKSLGPVFFDSIEVGAQGLAGDRQMMLVDAKGKFITQRTKTELVRFQIKKTENGFKVIDRWDQAEALVLPEDFTSEVSRVEIWDDEVQHVLKNEVLSEWFSEVLKESVSLVKLNPKFERGIAEKYQTDYSKSTSFADALPILMCTTASLKAVEEDYGLFDFMRFRPNIIVKNDIAFEEDELDELKIGGINFSMKKRCARCQLITVDPHSGQVDKQFLSRLSTYRTKENKVYFGVQLVPGSAGLISVGDSLSGF